MKTRRIIKRSDWLLILSFLLLALLLALLLWPRGEGTQAVIRQDGKPVLRLDLSEYSSSQPAEIPVGGVVFEIVEGKIRFRAAPCPDQICVETGFIDRPGETAVCLPERISVEIVSGEGGR